MACRDLKKCEEVRQTIVLETANKYVYCRKCDLASQDSIRKFAEKFNSGNYTEQNKSIDLNQSLCYTINDYLINLQRVQD